MPISIKADPLIDSVIDQIDFFDNPSYAIEIYPAKNVDALTIRGRIQALILTLSMDATFAEFAVDFKATGKVRVTGNLLQAMKELNANNEATTLFSKKLLLDIESHIEIQKILKASKNHYIKSNNDELIANENESEAKSEMPFFKTSRSNSASRTRKESSSSSHSEDVSDEEMQQIEKLKEGYLQLSDIAKKIFLEHLNNNPKDGQEPTIQSVKVQ